MEPALFLKLQICNQVFKTLFSRSTSTLWCSQTRSSTSMRQFNLSYCYNVAACCCTGYIWLLVYLILLRATLVGVSSPLYYNYVNSLHISAQLAIFKCTVWVVNILG
jgi:hypothetical protein